jgi:hypothetical protein
MGRPKKVTEQATPEVAVDTTEARLNALQQENLILQQKLAAQEAANIEFQKLSPNINSEMQKIMRKGRSGATTITVGESSDHTNITLWTRWGKPIGPMHPDNAVQALNRFAAVGIFLTVDKPTPEQATAWSNTAEGKAYWAKEASKRATKDKSKRSGQMEKLAAEIAKQTGTTVAALNKILQLHEVK